MEGEIVIKRWEDLDGEVSSYRLCCLLRLTSTLIRLWEGKDEMVFNAGQDSTSTSINCHSISLTCDPRAAIKV